VYEQVAGKTTDLDGDRCPRGALLAGFLWEQLLCYTSQLRQSEEEERGLTSKGSAC
jgi:hypothetical protein